jgi:ABC-type sugar transport system ATPase subunit
LFNRTVLENIVSARLSDIAPFGIVSWPRLRQLATQICSEVTVDINRLQANAFDLSGGNQQKLMFARAFGKAEPGVLLINEPTRGVDVGARAEIYRLMLRFCEMGYVLLITSSDLEEVVGISDLVVTMYRGAVVACYEGKEISASAILPDIIHPRSVERMAQ